MNRHSPSPRVFRRNHVYDPSSRLLEAEVFWAMLDRERALADRGDRRFAVLVFAVSREVRNGAQAATLAKAILARIRHSDAAGWLDDTRVGALLAGADAESGRRIAELIREQVRASGYDAVCEVYAYPRPGGSEEDELSGKGGDLCRREGVHVASLTGVHELLTPKVPLGKRLLDLFLASAAIVVLSPLLLGLALYIRVVSPGPVLFRQVRVGRACRPFECLKFRTMHVDADARVHASYMDKLIRENVPMAKLEAGDDPRLIPFARVIRAAGLDELPQLINVLRGEMSLVGPRPCIPYEFEKLSPWHRRRFDALPGLTGLWQVSGKNKTTFTQMIRHDVNYAFHSSPAQDAEILIRTIPAVVSQVRDTSHRRSRA